MDSCEHTAATSRAPARSPLAGGALASVGTVLAHRWAAGLGLAVGLLSVDGLQDGVPLGNALALAAVGYLLVAVVGRPGLTWPAALALVGVVVVLRTAGIPSVPVLAGAGFALAAVAVAAGRLRRSVLHLLQAPAAWVFGGAALAATLVPVEVGGVIVAVGLLAHALWDAVLWRAADPVVSRSFAEWCGVFDVVVAVGILLAVLS